MHELMAVHAAARHKARVLAAGKALVGAVKASGMARPVVTILAQGGQLFIEQAFVVRTMRTVACEAIVLHGRMRPHKRPALIGMAVQAQRVAAVFFKKLGAKGSMRIMAIRAGQFAFHDWMVRELIRLHANGLMATHANVCLQAPRGADPSADRGVQARFI